MSYKINKLFVDDFGRTSGIVAVNKPVGITSHDAVDMLRKQLKTKQVGHAGALDPFASGVLILLVGKATKFSDIFLNTDKDYLATIILGRSTDSADPEGNVLQDIDTSALDLNELSNQLNTIKDKFMPSYQQYVPIFSSVKIEGEKLRVMARSSDRFELADKDGVRIARFFKGDSVTEIPVPKHECRIDRMEFETPEYISFAEKTYASVKLDVACSKGTYIRALAEDVGAALPNPIPSMLSDLVRTRVGDIHLLECVHIEDAHTLISEDL